MPVNIVKCLSFEKLLLKGATKPFISRDEAGIAWVVKFHGNPLGTKSIFNEYVVGSLAEVIGLPWPEVTLIELTPNVLNILQLKGLSTLSKFATGLKYISGLRSIEWPQGVNSFFDKESVKRNAEHIGSIFPQVSDYIAFYGKAIFDNWLLLQDTKYESLHINMEGHPIFLDASYALCTSINSEWSCSCLGWNQTMIDIQSPYLDGILTDFANFDIWIERLRAIRIDVIESIIQSIPLEWSIPDDYLRKVKTLLSSTGDRFIPLFQEWISWQTYKSRYGM